MSDVLLESWVEGLDSFPVTGTLAVQARAALRYAVLAPSSHNAQPWLFRVADRTVELWLDRSRALPVADPDDRELTMSCGAALYHLRLALAYFGVATQVAVVPDRDEPDLLARVTLREGTLPDEAERELFHQIPRRRTNRRTFEPKPLPQSLEHALVEAARAEGAWLEIVEEEEDRGWLADLVAAADRRQLADKRFRRELAAWCHPNVSRRRDGIPGSGYGYGAVASLGMPLVLRTFDVGDGRAARDRELALGSPTLAVLGSDDDSAAALVRAGQAVARIALLASAAGASMSYLNQPIEVEDLRPEVERLLDLPGRAQLILRLGYGPPVPPTPRRPVGEVLIP